MSYLLKCNSFYGKKKKSSVSFLVDNPHPHSHPHPHPLVDNIGGACQYEGPPPPPSQRTHSHPCNIQL